MGDSISKVMLVHLEALYIRKEEVTGKVHSTKIHFRTEQTQLAG